MGPGQGGGGDRYEKVKPVGRDIDVGAPIVDVAKTPAIVVAMDRVDVLPRLFDGHCAEELAFSSRGRIDMKHDATGREVDFRAREA